jgi:hypothetical protein
MRIKRLLFVAAAGAAAEYFFDPQLGRTRRTKYRDRITGARNRTQTRVERIRRRTQARMQGYAARVQHPRDNPPADDVALARKVESKLFGDPEIPKGRLNVNVEDGVVVLRGQLDHAMQIRAVERGVRRIQGVRGVRSFLHVAGRPAPNKEASMRAATRMA